ncbi:osteopetrosis-associated transmembrane protein 1-like [Paramacrobiotus metropolitanus]|uniref:osteopetrosis-associated transmembrane protein 1-like n=1 Tax=Paramacrobiotus metropolitanus TaxID=2943436 RepID=UPI002445855C|nr:osteopetrosis-associated transmembrane protein 1-like [Paramacrobiotus metropolitanus]
MARESFPTSLYLWTTVIQILRFTTSVCSSFNSTNSTISTPKDISESWTRFAPYLTCSNDKTQLDLDCLATLVDDPDFTDRHTAFSYIPTPLYLSPDAPRSRAAVLHDCHENLTAYGYHSSAFLGCAVNFSRPILLCERCVEPYLIAQQSYIQYSQDMDQDGKSCEDMVYGSDMIGVVHRTNQSIESLWGDSRCSYCFNYYFIKHGTVQYQFSENLIIFMRKHRNLTDCFAKHGIILNFVLGDKMANITNSSLVCQECYPLYKDLSDFYYSNYTRDLARVCMDVVDVMNQTRIMWGKYFQCEKEHPGMFLVWAVTIIVFASTIVFYIAMFFNSSFEAYIIRRQDRLENSEFTSSQRFRSNSQSSDMSYAPL